jgi:glucose-6-phosphate dehydrogenase assembly protein OpcA
MTPTIVQPEETSRPVAVDIHAIERELTHLWEQVDTQTGEQKTLRVCSLNLVVWVDHPQAAERASEVIRGIIRKHPNRAMLIINDPDAPEAQLEAWVQANCQMTTPGAQQVCGEQISITAHDSRMVQVAGLVLSLLLPDLPVVLWWSGAVPFPHPLFQRLRHLVDHVVVDSAQFSDPTAGLFHLSQLYRQQSATSPQEEQKRQEGRGRGRERPRGFSTPSYALGDLNWGRLTPWRSLTAQFFDNRGFLPALNTIDTLVVAYDYPANQQPDHTQPLLLVGWLAACLNWTLAEPGNTIEEERETSPGQDAPIRLAFSRQQPANAPDAQQAEPITVELHPMAVAGPPALTALRLRAGPPHAGRFVVERMTSHTCIRTTAHLDGSHPICRTTRITAPSEEALLTDELRRTAPNEPLEKTLSLVSGILEQLQSTGHEYFSE